MALPAKTRWWLPNCSDLRPGSLARYFCLSAHIAADGLFDKASNLSSVLGAFVLWGLLRLAGYEVVSMSDGLLALAGVTIFLTFVACVTLFILRFLFLAPYRIWLGDQTLITQSQDDAALAASTALHIAATQDVALAIREGRSPQTKGDDELSYEDLVSRVWGAAARSRTAIEGKHDADIDFSGLYALIHDLKIRVIGTPLEPIIEPLATNVHLCLGGMDNIARLQQLMSASGRPERYDGDVLEERMRVTTYRYATLTASDAVMRSTADILYGGQRAGAVRALTKPQHDDLVRELRERKLPSMRSDDLWLRFSAGDKECKTFAQQLKSALPSAGWNGDFGTTLDERHDVNGLRICVENLDSKPAIANVLSESLRQAKIHFDWLPWPGMGDQVVHFVYPPQET